MEVERIDGWWSVDVKDSGFMDVRGEWVDGWINDGERMREIEVQLKNAARVDTFLKTEMKTFHFARSGNLETQVASFTFSTFLLLQKRN